MAAFADPDIKAVLATIGGDDQITVLPFLDPEVVMANPKAFFGYSDNTNLLNWLWYHGIAGYHGGSTMVHLGRPGGLHPVSTASLRAALLDGGELPLHQVDRFSEVELSWADPPGSALPRADVSGAGLGVAPARPGGDRADLGRQPGDPALDPRRRALDPGRPRTTPDAC